MFKKAILVIFAGILLSSCGKQKDLIIVTCGTYKPFSYTQNNQLKGIDIEIIQQIANASNSKILLLSAGQYDLIEYVSSVDVDGAICAISPDDKSKKIVNFSQIYHGENIEILVNRTNYTGKVLLEAKNEKELIDVMKELSQSRIGAIAGTLSEKIAKDYAIKYFDDSSVITFKQTKSALKALTSGDIDLLLLVRNSTDYKQSFPKLAQINSPLFSENFAIAISKNKPELLAQVNEILKQMKANGTLEKIKKKYSKM